MSKVITSSDAAKLISDGAVLATEGFVGCMFPEKVALSIEERFKNEGHPKDLTILFAAGQGDGKERGLNIIAHEGLIKRSIGGHYGLAPKLQKLILEKKAEGYNFPQGVISQMFRDIAAKRPATITHVGLKTFVDPRIEAGRINDISNEDYVSVVNLYGKEYLAYRTIPIDVAIVRATYADENGNATLEHECVALEGVSLCQAAKNSGGIVILQVEKVVQNGSLDTRLIKIPGIYVDYIVEAPAENHMQTNGTSYNPAYSGEVRVPVSALSPLPMDQRKIIARRAAMELVPASVTNLGIGVPEGIATVAAEEGLSDELFLTVEAGIVGGVPAGGSNFGASTNPDCILDQPYQFDFYDGGGLDVAFLGLAQCDAKGNINVSKFGPKVAGCGGFINITQNAKKVVYCGTFTAGGLTLSVNNGKLSIDNEGKSKKFVSEVEQISFSGDYAIEKGQPVLYITERAVFTLTKDGVVLTEIAPGVDLQKDVLDLMEFKPIISPNLKTMDERIFKDEKMGLVLK